MITTVPQALRISLKSRFGHRLREALLYPRLLRGGSRPRIMFFPSSTREDASLLRAYRIAEALDCTGWTTCVIPKQLELTQRARMVRLFDPDLLVFQKCRHPLNDVAYAFGRPFIVDIDDADFFDPALHDKLVRTCAAARGVIAGSRFIADWCGRHADNVTVIWTGGPSTAGPRPAHDRRARIVAWAQAAPLGYPRELAFVQKLHEALRSGGVDFRLRLYGVNSEAERAQINELFGNDDRLETLSRLKYHDFLVSLRDVAVGLSPIIPESDFSRGKSFGKILGYLDAKVPVICSDHADHAAFFNSETGIVTNDFNTWVKGIRVLLDDPSRREEMSEAAYRDSRARLSTEAAARQVAAFIEKIL